MADILVLGERRLPLVPFIDMTCDDIDMIEDATGMSLDEVLTAISEVRATAEFFTTRSRRRALAALVWAARTRDGDEVGVLEALSGVSMRDFDVVSDDPPEEEEPADPTPADSVPGESADVA